MSDQETLVPASAPTPAEKKGMSRRTLIFLIVVVAVILALLGALFAWYLTTKKPLSQIPVFSAATPPGYSFSVFDVTQPLGVAIDEANNRMYVTQSSGDRNVAVFDLDGTKVGALTSPVKKGAIQTPVYVAVNPTTSEVYVSDRANATIYVYSAQGKYLREIKPKGIKQWAPLAMAFDPQGNLFVSDVSAPTTRVLKIDAKGKVLQTVGKQDQLSFPNGLAVLQDGSLAIADSNNGRVLVAPPSGSPLAAIARGNADAPLGLPRGAAVDDRGRLYVVDTVNNVVRVYAPSDTKGAPPIYSFSFGEEGIGDGQFEYPNAVATDTRGRIYVTDRENNRIQVWSY
jgi:DNA-binding beta-propeller fold protein YncE